MYKAVNRCRQYLDGTANAKTHQGGLGEGFGRMSLDFGQHKMANGLADKGQVSTDTTDRKQAFRAYVLRHAKKNGVNINRLSDVRKWLVQEFGPGFESTARRIIDAERKPTANTIDLLAERFGERFDGGEVRPQPVTGDQKAKQAGAIAKLAPIAKHATREDLARLAEEAAADPADVKLVAMILLMFRDA
jgi:hypothetical protein